MQMQLKTHARLPFLLLSSVLVLLALFAMGAIKAVSLTEAVTGNTHLVCSSGCDFNSVQNAVDAAGSGDLIKVAEGTYTSVETRTAPSGYEGPDTISQVVYLSKSVTIRGGYSTSNWTTPDPIAHPTILDAQGQGRVLFIYGDIAAKIEGLRLTGGDAYDLGGNLWTDVGGGIYVHTASVTISNCDIYENVAGSEWGGAGGGISLTSSPATIQDSTIHDNVASTSGDGYGGGIALDNSPATITRNKIFNNVASSGDWGYGGGVDLYASDAVLNTNEITNNFASTSSQGYGGGLHIAESAAEIANNTIRDNTASTVHDGFGGGLHLSEGGGVFHGNIIKGNVATANSSSYGYGGGLDLFLSSATLSSNIIQDNIAGSGVWSYGGGLSLADSGGQMINNVIIDNQAGGIGAGLYISGTVPSLTHTTIARNRGGDGTGLYLTHETELALTNTILVDQTTGLHAESGTEADLDGILWHGNTNNYSGDGTVNVSSASTGDPAFTSDGYHVSAGSAAIDAGIDAQIEEDIDGESRPNQIADLGADEYWSSSIPTATNTPVPSPTPSSTPAPDAENLLYLPVINGR